MSNGVAGDNGKADRQSHPALLSQKVSSVKGSPVGSILLTVVNIC